MILPVNNSAAWAAIFVLLTATTLSSQQQDKENTPSQACGDAISQMELDQCAGQQYRKADARLNAIYHKTIDLMKGDLADAQKDKDPNQIKYVQQSIDKLRAAEKAWVQYRDLHCEGARHQYEGGCMNPMIWGFCMADTTLDRIKELKSAYEDGDRKLE
jgi:uncharacterized protein YecT (DUF1311 family)